MLKKVTKSLLAASLLLALAVTGCGQNATADKQQGKPGEKVTVVFWDENAGPQRTPFYQELIKRFEEKNPNIHVEYVGLPKNAAKQKYDAAIAANDTPDVAGVQTTWLADFTARKALLEMDPFFDKWSDKDKISKQIIESNRAAVLDKKLYQIPNTMNMEILWYRPDWFKEAGIKAPETWDEFFTAVEKITDKEKNRYGFSIRGGNGASFQLQRMMYAYSGITEYIDAKGKCTVNDPKHIEFLKKYLGMYKVYTPISDVTNGYQQMVAAFDTGAVAMIQHNIGSYGEHSKALKPGQYAPLLIPKTADGRYIQEGANFNGYSIFKSTKQPEAAWKFVSFLASAESQSYWNQSIGQIPTHLDSLKEPWAKELPHMQLALSLLSNPKLTTYEPPIYLPDYRSILDQIVDPGIQAVMTGKKTEEQYLNEWAVAVEKSKQKYDAYMAGKK
jgi:multiple sugar transport system substrate-binding protein